MQGSNSTRTARPKAKDGTQEAKGKGSDANWYGASQEPQEEYIENDPYPERREPGHDPLTSEGQPTIEGSGPKR